MANTVVGFFRERSEAADAVAELVKSGINREDIDVSNSTDTSDSSYNTESTSGYDVADRRYEGVNRTTDRDKDDEKGNAISRFFNNLFGDDTDDSRKYSTASQYADTIVTVHATSISQAQEAASILDDCGAMDIDEDSLAGDTYTQTSSSGRSSGMADRNLEFDANQDIDSEITANEAKIDVMREELQVGKRSVETGGVRVRSRIIERPVEESLRLREEHVRVHRQPVDRVADVNDMDSFQEKEIELTEYAEVPVVNKEARVVEEIRLSKGSDVRQETVRDTVRETKVDIDNDPKRSKA